MNFRKILDYLLIIVAPITSWHVISTYQITVFAGASTVVAFVSWMCYRRAPSVRAKMMER